METETIRAIFTNVLFVIGVILAVFGFVYGVSTTSKILVFNEYPLQPYEETKCLYEPYPSFIRYEDTQNNTDMIPEENKEESERLKAECEATLERDRQIKMVNDVTTSVGLLTAGSVLVVAFRRFIFRS